MPSGKLDISNMQQDEFGPTETRLSYYKIRLLWAGAFVSGLVATDLFLNFFCSFWHETAPPSTSRWFYLAAAGLWAGRFSGSGDE